jgi:tetratricopeptide (TPR) repeat protein
LNTYPLASLLPLQQTIAETLQNAKEHGELAHCTTLYRVQARIFLALGNIEEANKMIQQGMVFLDSVGALNRKEQLLVTQAQIALACGDLHQASRSRQQAMPHMHQYHHADDLAATLGIQGELALREDQIDQAATFFQQMAELAPVEHCILQAQIHFGNARVAAAQHRIRDARLEAEKSLQILQMLQHHKAEEIETWLQTLPTPLFAKLPFVNRGKRSKKAV